jgi:hypothetical protein
MRWSTATALFMLASAAAIAQDRHPLVAKAIEVTAAGRAVADLCPGWSSNPAITQLLWFAISASNLSHQLERSQSTIAEMHADIVSRGRSSAEAFCATATPVTMENPFNGGAPLPLYVRQK